jgi:hypothetical protein
MAKYKVKTKDSQLMVKVRLSVYDYEKMDERQFTFFTGKNIRGLLKVKNKKKTEIEYFGPKGISLTTRFKQQINKFDFLYIIEQIVELTRNLNKNSLILSNVKWDLDYIFINEVTRELSFIYLPLENDGSRINLLNLFEVIAYAINPVISGDIGYVERFYNHIRSLSEYNADKIEQFVLKEDIRVVNMVRNHSSSQSGYMTDNFQHYYDHMANKSNSYNNMGSFVNNSEATGLLQNEEATGLLQDEEGTGLLQNEEATGLLQNEEATGLLQDEEATGLLQNEEGTGLLQDEEATGLLNKVNYSKDNYTNNYCKNDYNNNNYKENYYGNQNLNSNGYGNQNLNSNGYGNQNLNSNDYGNQNLNSNGYGNQNLNSNDYGNQNLNSNGYSNNNYTGNNCGDNEPTGLLNNYTHTNNSTNRNYHNNSYNNSSMTGILNNSADNNVDNEPTGLLNNYGAELTGLLNNDYEEETGLLNDTVQRFHYPSVYRVFTDETFLVNKPVFRIGKERSYSDYFVANNNMVSRCHADIISRNGKYYIVDLNSKNRTYVNGVPIPAQQETEIYDGDAIRLANEEFIFKI